MSDIRPIDILAARPWDKAIFTTYALSLSFFEAVALDALVRGGAKSATILADTDGLRSALSEQGAQRVGRDYEVEPVSVSGGVFHSKLSLLLDPEDGHMLVGSGNLTFGGWGLNLECIEHLHPSFAGNAFRDAAQFFAGMADSNRLHHHAAELCGETSERLMRLGSESSDSESIRLFNNLDRPIVEQVSQVIADLGGARRLVSVSPFYDNNGDAIGSLCDALSLDHAFIHAHHFGGTVEGKIGTNWPKSDRVEIKPVSVHIFDHEKSPRRLHAKIYEIVCERGRVILSGSPNMTTAALGSTRNVETCVVRIQRDAFLAWNFASSDPLTSAQLTDESEEETQYPEDILRAVLDGDTISGSLIGSRLCGDVTFSIHGLGGADLGGETTVDVDGRFAFAAPDLELRAWTGGRLVLSIKGPDDRMARGFISLAAFSELTKRAGTNAARFMAILSGTETPEDVSAIMSWFYEDPRRLVGSIVQSSAVNGASDKHSEDEQWIAVSQLGRASSPLAGKIDSEKRVGAAWERFLSALFSSMRKRRGSFPEAKGEGSGDDDDLPSPSDAAQRKKKFEKEKKRTLKNFEKLFDRLTKNSSSSYFAFTALNLANYICDRLAPDYPLAKIWLRQAMVSCLRHGVSEAERELVACAVFLFHACEGRDDAPKNARRSLLKIGFNFDAGPPNLDELGGFLDILGSRINTKDFFLKIALTRTFQEQVHSYLELLEHGRATGEFADLRALEEWSVLESALANSGQRQKLLLIPKPQSSCPKCHIALPKAEYGNLLSKSVCTARNCCRRVIVSRRL
ncbi:MAG: hypothetical protein ABJH07_03005 [Sedimentitalea sp.]|uniref:hypothetical protein n=1 Tax=Sedimentitalea sp. TaxID=2048915 RepID=UPI0032677B1E